MPPLRDAQVSADDTDQRITPHEHATTTKTVLQGARASGRAKKPQLEALLGYAFDASYVSSQIKAHEDAVALLQKDQFRQPMRMPRLAQKSLPTVQSHLQALDKLAGLGVSHQ